VTLEHLVRVFSIAHGDVKLGTRLFGLADSVWPFRSRDISVRLWDLAEILH